MHLPEGRVRQGLAGQDRLPAGTLFPIWGFAASFCRKSPTAPVRFERLERRSACKARTHSHIRGTWGKWCTSTAHDARMRLPDSDSKACQLDAALGTSGHSGRRFQEAP